MEKYGTPGMPHPSTGIHHNIEQPKGPHIPLPQPVNHTGHKTPSVHSHHSHNGMTHTPVSHHASTRHHGGNHTNHHHGHTGHHSHKK